MKEIKLTKGKVAIVDDEDFDSLSKFSWYAAKSKKVWYAFMIGSRKSMHSFIMGKSTLKIDHKDCNGLNNRRENLRFATNSQNSANKGSLNSNNTTGYRGVIKRKNNWQAAIRFKRKVINLGRFDTPEEAAREVDKALKFYFGEFHGKLNLE